MTQGDLAPSIKALTTTLDHLRGEMMQRHSAFGSLRALRGKPSCVVQYRLTREGARCRPPGSALDSKVHLQIQKLVCWQIKQNRRQHANFFFLWQGRGRRKRREEEGGTRCMCA